MKKTYRSLIVYVWFTTLLLSCKAGTDKTEEESAVVAQTPVQIVTIANGAITDEVVLNATSAYLEKSYVKATTNGYIQSLSVQTGTTVKSNQVLFKLITKEARAIGNTINQLDPDFKFSGISVIRAEKNGFVTQVNHQKGDYVQDGEAMAVISNEKSLVFLLDLPYEMRSIVLHNNTLLVTLPDGEKLSGKVTAALPSVDSLAQTQRLIIQVKATHPIPEKLIGKVNVVKSAVSNIQLLPKSAVLTNETEDVFWVMKMINDSTAVKTVVKKGMENEKSIQILSPIFKSSDRLITVGNYGLADTAKVKITR